MVSLKNRCELGRGRSSPENKKVTHESPLSVFYSSTTKSRMNQRGQRIYLGKIGLSHEISLILKIISSNCNGSLFYGLEACHLEEAVALLNLSVQFNILQTVQYF